jgi:serine/threonine protein kinase
MTQEQQEDATLIVNKDNRETTTLDGRYEVLQKIGSGGMGTVFAAKQTSTGRKVAVKVLRSTTESERFEQEVAALRDLSHPNLVTVIDSGKDAEGKPYLVLEYIDGKGLDAVLRAKGSLSDNEFRDIFVQVCRGLAHAHSKGIVHRDLKPSNIMVIEEQNGERIVKIVDFGIAKKEDSAELTVTGDIVGSPAFMSPEQATGQKLDARSDIYSLGCIMYQCLSGRLPFTAEQPLAALVKRLNDDAKPLQEAAGDRQIPEPWLQLVKKAMSRDPDARFSNVAEMVPALVQVRRTAGIGISEVNGTSTPTEKMPATKHDTKGKIAGVRISWLALAIAALVACLVWMATTPPSEESIRQREAQAREYIKGREYARAIELLRGAISDAKKLNGGKSALLAILYVDVNEAEQNMGDKRAAKEALENALAAAGSELSPRARIGVKRDLALLEMEDGNFDKADKLIDEAHDEFERTYPDDEQGIATLLAVQGLVAEQRHDYAVARNKFEDAIEMLERNANGVPNPFLAEQQANLARIYAQEDNVARALPLYERALFTLKRLGQDKLARQIGQQIAELSSRRRASE